MTEELYIDGEAVDLKPDAATTLNYKSNLLGGISKITASNSQTIQCPKTPRNRKIFDNPGAPAYVSDRRYKRYSARLVRNGVEVVRVGYAVLLSASEHYEIGLYWGVMANFQAWVDKAAKLNELDGTEALTWNRNVTATALSTFKSRGYGYARYDCGVANTDLVNIHPSVTAWWILNKISTQAGFRFDMPSKYEEQLRTMAIPCLGKNAIPESWVSEKTFVSAYCINIYEFIGPDMSGHPAMYYTVGYISANSCSQTHPIFLGNNIEYGYYANYSTDGEISWPRPTDYRTVYMAEFTTLSLKEMEVKIDALSVNAVALTTLDMYARKEGGSYILFESWRLLESPTIREVIDCSGFDHYYFIISEPRQESAAYQVNIEIIPHVDKITYPSTFSIASNLPEITQIDFIKAICAMLGIFVVPDPTDSRNLKFVSFDILQANKVRAHDWSNKLVGSNEDEPKTVEFKVNDYCRNNYFKYKEDDTVATNADGNLTIASEVLEREQTAITLPFAASDGSKVPHYKLSDDGLRAEDVQIKERIMGLVDDGSGLAALSFAGLSFSSLLSKYYSTLSELLNNAIMITEQIQLSEIDLKSLDYSVPFYLRQYGKYYGIISIQSAAGKACEVKAVQLPKTGIEEDDPIDPSLITNTIGVREEPPATYITALYPLASDLTVEYNEYLYGDPTPYPRSLIFPKGETEIATGPDSRLHDRTELTSLTPASDDMYNYVIVQQSEEK